MILTKTGHLWNILVNQFIILRIGEERERMKYLSWLYANGLPNRILENWLFIKVFKLINERRIIESEFHFVTPHKSMDLGINHQYSC